MFLLFIIISIVNSIFIIHFFLFFINLNYKSLSNKFYWLCFLSLSKFLIVKAHQPFHQILVQIYFLNINHLSCSFSKRNSREVEIKDQLQYEKHFQPSKESILPKEDWITQGTDSCLILSSIFWRDHQT